MELWEYILPQNSSGFSPIKRFASLCCIYLEAAPIPLSTGRHFELAQSLLKKYCRTSCYSELTNCSLEVLQTDVTCLTIRQSSTFFCISGKQLHFVFASDELIEPKQHEHARKIFRCTKW